MTYPIQLQKKHGNPSSHSSRSLEFVQSEADIEFGLQSMCAVAMGKKFECKAEESSKTRRVRGSGSRSSSDKKGAIVFYNPLAHAEFVTGFRKRKNARRLEAQARLAEAEREKLRLARKEKRSFIQETAALMRRSVDVEDKEKCDEVGACEKSFVYRNDDTVITTIVSKMENNSHKGPESIKSTMKPLNHKDSCKKSLAKDVGSIKNTTFSTSRSAAGRNNLRQRSGVMKKRRVQRPKR